MIDDERPAPRDGRLREEERALVFEGEEIGRVLSLSDGIFAFAMTLLVLDLTLPRPGESAAALFGSLGILPFIAYVVGFLIIGTFWVGHNRLFRHFLRWDTGLLYLNLLFLVTIAIDPFVIGVYMISGPSFDSVAAAAGVWALSGALMLLIWRYATYERRLVDRDLSEEYVTNLSVILSVTPLFFGASIAVAVVQPSPAEFLWIVGIVLQALLRRRLAGTARWRRHHGPERPESPP